MAARAIVILCTAPAKGEQAANLARGLVEARLAACVNIVPGVQSFYRWKGMLEEEVEVQLLIKTRGELFGEVAGWLEEHHPYEVPEVIALPVEEGSSSYLSWIEGQTRS